MSESKESPGFVLNDAPRDPSYYHSPEPPVEEPSAPPAAQEDTAPRPEPRLVPHAAPPEPPPSKSRRWLPRLAMVIVFIALAALFIRLINGRWENNVLMAAPSDIYDLAFEAAYMPVFGSDITRQEIGTVTFLSTVKDAPVDAWDVSVDHSGSVLAWVIRNGDLYDLYIAGNGGVNGVYACQNLFTGYVNLTNIDFADSFHTEQSINMSRMFFNCHSLTKLDLSSFNTENVTDMSAMFRGCTKLGKLDLRNFNTDNITDLSAMFWLCINLTELDLSSFNTELVTDMSSMFENCPGITMEDVAHFDTSSVEYYGNFMEGTGWEYLFE